MWLLGFLLTRTLTSPCLGHEPKVRVATSTILELICFHHYVCFQFVCFLRYGLVCYVSEMKTLGIYMSLKGYVSNSKYFWIIMLLKCDILGETCFWKDLVFFLGDIFMDTLVIMKWCFGRICLWKAIILWSYVSGNYFWKILIFCFYVSPNPCFSIIMSQHLCVFGGIFTCVSSTKRYFYIIVLDSKFHCEQVLNLSLYFLVFLLNAN